MTRPTTILLASLILTACSVSGGRPTPTISAAAAIVSSPTPTSAFSGVWVQPGVPRSIASRALEKLTRAGFVQTDDPNLASVRLMLDPPPEAALASQAVYALVAPFPTITDGVSLGDLKGYWMGTIHTLPGFEAPPQLIIPAGLVDMLSARLGQPGSIIAIASDQPNALIDAAWNSRPAISVIPFDQLEPRWKVLSIDGQSPLDKKLDANTYPLTLRTGVVAAEPLRDQVIGLLQTEWEATNHDPSKMTVVVMTGTTALTRSTAYMMELKGINYPAQNILPFFADKDILHISNEVSFTPKCPPPDPNGDEQFCSSPNYLDLLTGIGADIVELTGNHNNDYGINPTNYSLELYEKNGLPYFGGGRNLEDAVTPRILTAPDGARIAFIGCNSAGPFKAYATTETPGAAPCGDWAWIRQAIRDLKATGVADVVIASVQYHESPDYAPEKQQVINFQALAESGADIVSGSQAHVPQGFAISGQSFIHYGVGNLFFDQMDLIKNRQMFADKYLLYGGRLISVMLFTGMMEDYSQPRPMTPQERSDFLKLIFAASGW